MGCPVKLRRGHSRLNISYAVFCLENRMRTKLARLAGAGLVFYVAIANAYQTDVHYGLTHWLADRAGFAPAETHEIARGNEMTDVGQLDAVHAIVHGMCAELDTAKAEQASK